MSRPWSGLVGDGDSCGSIVMAGGQSGMMIALLLLGRHGDYW